MTNPPERDPGELKVDETMLLEACVWKQGHVGADVFLDLPETARKLTKAIRAPLPRNDGAPDLIVGEPIIYSEPVAVQLLRRLTHLCADVWNGGALETGESWGDLEEEIGKFLAGAAPTGNEGELLDEALHILWRNTWGHYDVSEVISLIERAHAPSEPGILEHKCECSHCKYDWAHPDGFHVCSCGRRLGRVAQP